METNIKKSFECMNACILNHLNSAGMNISGSDIFFCGRGYPVYYQKGTLTQIKSEGYDANFRFLNQYGIDYRFGRISPTADTMKRLLQESYTVTIRMISDCLLYDKVFSQTSGASHFINVLAYDKTIKQFYIVDGDVPSATTGCYAGWISEKELIRGWELKGGETLQMDFSKISENKDFCHFVREEANRQLKPAVQEYLNGKRPLLGDKITGKKAIYFMIKQLSRYAGKCGFRELTRDANFRLRVDGFMGSKYFLLEKLKEQNLVTATGYESILQGWSRWCMLLLKSGLAPSQVEGMELVEKRMEELMTSEEQCLEKICILA